MHVHNCTYIEPHRHAACMHSHKYQASTSALTHTRLLSFMWEFCRPNTAPSLGVLVVIWQNSINYLYSFFWIMVKGCMKTGATRCVGVSWRQRDDHETVIKGSSSPALGRSAFFLAISQSTSSRTLSAWARIRSYGTPSTSMATNAIQLSVTEAMGCTAPQCFRTLLNN